MNSWKHFLGYSASSSRYQIMCSLCILLLSGCALEPKITSEYGRKVGRTGAASVNGTSVLGRMFREGGARVKRSTRLGRIVEKAEVVVWFPDRYSLPSEETRAYFEDWLAEDSGRTLIYVGRDFDATSVYWRRLVETARPDQPEQALEARKKLALALVAEAAQRAVYEPKDDCDWFALDRTRPSRRVDSLSGSLSYGVDEKKIDVQVHSRILPGGILLTDEFDYRGRPEFEPLLSSRGDTIVGRFTRENWTGSQIIVVSNGSWLLNLPLVNHEHRRMAGNLLGECGQVERVVFLESGPGDPPISSHEPNQHHGLAAFTVWPINCILMHVLALGIVFCFTAFPIFGRPRRLEETDASDFGKHVFAIGELLSRTQDRHFAQRCRQQYQQRVAEPTSATSATTTPTTPTTAMPDTTESSANKSTTHVKAATVSPPKL